MGEEVQALAASSARYTKVLPCVDEANLCIVQDVLCPRNILTWAGGSIMVVLEVGPTSC